MSSRAEMSVGTIFRLRRLIPVWLAWSVAALGAAGGGCARVRSAGSTGAASLELRARVGAPPGVALVAACTPSGLELCFNAVDDNCNGVIDEGCGVATGPLQFIVAWGDSPADVDLVVTGPSGERVDHANRATASGLHLDRDCPSEGCGGQNTENVSFEGSDPARGHYDVDIRLKALNGAAPPVRLRFGARVGSRSYGADVLLMPDDTRALRDSRGEVVDATKMQLGEPSPERVTFAFDL
jgi:hypothetical protein